MEIEGNCLHIHIVTFYSVSKSILFLNVLTNLRINCRSLWFQSPFFSNVLIKSRMDCRGHGLWEEKYLKPWFSSSKIFFCWSVKIQFGCHLFARKIRKSNEEICLFRFKYSRMDKIYSLTLCRLPQKTTTMILLCRKYVYGNL